jgi:deoxyribodipyrimidine photolyase
MVTASFLIEYLGISWVEGARWYHDTLVDADVAINAMMWQVRALEPPCNLEP